MFVLELPLKVLASNHHTVFYETVMLVVHRNSWCIQSCYFFPLVQLGISFFTCLFCPVLLGNP
jgi:hypothetical protein